jgi:hypothetical protein
MVKVYLLEENTSAYVCFKYPSMQLSLYCLGNKLTLFTRSSLDLELRFLWVFFPNKDNYLQITEMIKWS